MSESREREADLIPYARQCIEESDIEAVVQVLRSDFVTQGPRQEWLESALREVTGARHAVAVSSGTAALTIAVRALGVGSGDMGLVPSITFVATANCLPMAGAEARFAEVDARTGLSEAGHFRNRAEQLGVAPEILLPVSLAGSCPDLRAIRQFADSVGAAVVEDASHSIGASYLSGQSVSRSASCVDSDAATLSFHPVKHICAGEGGAVLTNDDTLARRARRLRSHGIERPASLREEEGPWAYDQVELSGNYRLTELQAALAISQLDRLERNIERRREIANCYEEAFGSEPYSNCFDRPKWDEGSAWHLYPIRFRDAVARKGAYHALLSEGIRPQIHYRPVYRNSYYKESQADPHPGAEAYYAGCLSLPMYPSLSNEQQSRVIEVLGAICARA